jgi:hypothetical protein
MDAVRSRSVGIWIVLVLIVGVIIAKPAPTQNSSSWDWVAKLQAAHAIVELEILQHELAELDRRMDEASPARGSWCGNPGNSRANARLAKQRAERQHVERMRRNELQRREQRDRQAALPPGL